MFKEIERPESAAILIDDDDLVKLIGAWPSIQTFASNTKAKCEETKTSAALWHWLWACFDVKLEDVAMALGVPEAVAEYRMNRAILARLIYPDGSVNRYANGYVGARIRASLMVPGGMARRPKRKGGDE